MYSLATFLHADHVAARVRAVAPGAQISAAPVVGFFLDHEPFPRQSDAPSVDNATVTSGYPNNGSSSYGSWMANVVSMQNISATSLLPKCLAANPSDPHLCFMSPHMAQYVETPLFMFNSKFDAWQMVNDLQVSAGSHLLSIHPSCTSHVAMFSPSARMACMHQMPCYPGDKPSTRPSNITCSATERAAVEQ
jgi:hypothetical protein